MTTSARWKRTLYLLLGVLALGLAYVGAVMPGIPTLPFVLLAAACFMRSSPHMHKWLLQHRWFGRMATDFHERRGSPMRFSLVVLIPSWVSVIVAMYVAPDLVHRLVILAIAILGSIALIRFAKQYFKHPESIAEDPR